MGEGVAYRLAEGDALGEQYRVGAGELSLAHSVLAYRRISAIGHHIVDYGQGVHVTSVTPVLIRMYPRPREYDLNVAHEA
jgi:hypothetical protein